MEVWLVLGGALFIYMLYKNNKNHAKPEMDVPKKAKRKQSTRVSACKESHIDSHSYESDSEELATFRIIYGYDEEVSSNETPGKWLASDETVIVNGQEVRGGNFYFGGRLASVDCYGTEASLVDSALPIENASSDYEDDSLGYWPKFITLTPKARGAYINWLASSRNASSTPLGYVFIYFYGIERRIVVDSIDDQVSDLEFKVLFEETSRLIDVYGDSYSFYNYASRLMEMMCLLRPKVVSSSRLESSPLRDSLLFKYQLAKTVVEGKPIPAEMALAWIRFYPEYSFRRPARRCADEFSELFRRQYREKYGDGLVVKENKTRLKIAYSPASSSLRGISMPQENLPDPSNLKGPLKKLVSIADQCTEDLDAYSRYLGKANTSRSDIEAVLLLPEALDGIGSVPGFDNFRAWADEAIANNDGIVNSKDLWAHTQSPVPEKINKKEAELIQRFAEKAGYGIAPDTRYHHAKPTIDGKMVLFAKGHGKHFEPSGAFSEMGMALRLGAMVASTDAIVDKAEYDLLARLIAHDTNLSPTEKSSLNAYLLWRLNTPSNITGLKKRLECLGTTEKTAVSEILVSVAMADGRIDPDEVKQLEKLYTLLGLDKSLVTGHIHEMSSSAGRANTPSTPNNVSNNRAQDGFEIDEGVLARHERETKDVQSMLGAIFVEDDFAEEVEPEKPAINEVDMGIDKSHYQLFESLIKKDEWRYEEVVEMCRTANLMIGGALETINDWSFENVDAPVFEEDGDSIFVDQEVVEELEGIT